MFLRFQEPKEHHDDRTETMLKIYEDSTIASDSQDRCCAQLLFLYLYFLPYLCFHAK